VRIALGASKSRIVSQLLTESVVLATIGSALGLLVANLALRIIIQSVPATSPDCMKPRSIGACWHYFARHALTGVLFGSRRRCKHSMSICKLSPRIAPRLLEFCATSSAQRAGCLRNCPCTCSAGGAGLLTNSFVRLLACLWASIRRNYLLCNCFYGSQRVRSDTRSSQVISAILERVRTFPACNPRAW